METQVAQCLQKAVAAHDIHEFQRWSWVCQQHEVTDVIVQALKLLACLASPIVHISVRNRSAWSEVPNQLS